MRKTFKNQDSIFKKSVTSWSKRLLSRYFTQDLFTQILTLETVINCMLFYNNFPKQCFLAVLVRRSKKGDAELVLLDHGLYEELPLKVRRSLCQLWSAIVLNDHHGMKRYSAELGVQGKFFQNTLRLFAYFPRKKLYLSLPVMQSAMKY